MEAEPASGQSVQRYYDPLIPHFLSVDPVTVDSVTGWNFCRYCYADNNPYKFKDPDGRIIDTIADIAFIGYDIYQLAKDPSWTNAGALGADVVGAAVPFATGLGAAVRAGAHGADAIKGAEHAIEAAKDAGKATEGAAGKGLLPKPPTGPGSVPKAERDPKRFFDPKAREGKRAEQGNKCANGCGTTIDASNSAGHHIERHADGGQTVPENHAEVCIKCHQELHSGE